MQRGLGRGGGEATPSNGAPALVAHKLPFAAVSRSDSITCVLSHPLADALANRDSAQQQLALASCPEHPPASSQDVCLFSAHGRHGTHFCEGESPMSPEADPS